jgi:hypothetical protein
LLNPFNKIPEQVVRLSIVFILLISSLIFLRTIFIPKNFGKYGHYRGAALEEAKTIEIKFAGKEVCADCHDDIFHNLQSGYHKTLSCEGCHGPAKKHIDSGGEWKPEKPTSRDFCLICHSYLPARPTGFPQVDPYVHHPPERCVKCHEPHNPVLPATPAGCEVCHASIARMKAVSSHYSLECSTCHQTSTKHKFDPRKERPSKPTDRTFCGKCHSRTSNAPSYIPRIEMETHGRDYLCWECHYPHSPEGG